MRDVLGISLGPKRLRNEATSGAKSDFVGLGFGLVFGQVRYGQLMLLDQFTAAAVETWQMPRPSLIQALPENQCPKMTCAALTGDVYLGGQDERNEP